MTTPFDLVVNEFKERGFHNHRKEEHSDTLSLGILQDLTSTCEPLRAAFATGRSGIGSINQHRGNMRGNWTF